MNRALKFKVWDNEKKRMSNPIGIAANFIKWNDGDIDMPVLFAEAKTDRFIFLQYTGLKPISEQEFCEGDVIQYPNPRCRGVIKFGLYRFAHFEALGYYVQRIDDPDLVEPLEDHSFKRCQVIGNLYENPELLKERFYNE